MEGAPLLVSHLFCLVWQNVLLFDIHGGIIGTKGGVSDGSKNSKCPGPCRA